MNDKIKVDDVVRSVGRVKVRHTDKFGNLKHEEEGPNLTTNAGKAAMAGLIGNTGGITAFTYLALGTSSTAVAVTDTTLGAEIVDTGLARAVATISRTTTSVTNDTLNLVYTWTASGIKTVTECGILNAASTGTLLAHKLLTNSVATANGDLFMITYTFQLT